MHKHETALKVAAPLSSCKVCLRRIYSETPALGGVGIEAFLRHILVTQDLMRPSAREFTSQVEKWGDQGRTPS